MSSDHSIRRFDLFFLPRFTYIIVSMTTAQSPSVGLYMKEQSKKLGISPELLAVVGGCSVSTIYNIQKGKTEFGFEIVQKILSYLQSKGAPDFDLYQKHFEADEFAKDRDPPIDAITKFSTSSPNPMH